MTAWPPEPPTVLTNPETEMVERALALLERTHYDDENSAAVPERVFDARAIAHGLVELALALDAERSARVAIQQARDNCLEILERQAGAAAAEAGK